MKLVDLHVHIDFYSNPLEVANKYESLNIYAIFVTYLPEIFLKTFREYEQFDYVRIALGFHPDMVGEYDFNEEDFSKGLQHTRYIGEVGLDFSKANRRLQNEQIQTFERITKSDFNKGKIFSVHSRKAEREVLEILKANNVRNAIFHWYSGEVKLLQEIANEGYFFSVNHRMLSSKKGVDVIKHIPKSQLLFETDGPFARKERKIVYPEDIKETYLEFEKNIPGFQKIVFNNFKRLLVQKDIDLLS